MIWILIGVAVQALCILLLYRGLMLADLTIVKLGATITEQRASHHRDRTAAAVIIARQAESLAAQDRALASQVDQIGRQADEIETLTAACYAAGIMEPL